MKIEIKLVDLIIIIIVSIMVAVFTRTVAVEHLTIAVCDNVFVYVFVCGKEKQKLNISCGQMCCTCMFQ